MLLCFTKPRENIIVATCTRDNDSHTLKHINLIETRMPA